MGYGFHWPPGRNPYLVTPEGKVVPLLVRKDIPYMMVGSSRSVPKDPKAFVEVPIMPVIEQDTSAQMDTGNQSDETNVTESPSTSDLSPTTDVEKQLGRNPYGYTGSLSVECEIPLDVLKHIYETFGDDCEDGDARDHDVAVVVKEKGRGAEAQEDSSALHREVQLLSDYSHDTQPAVWDSPPKKKRRIDVDPVDTEDEDKMCDDTCDCNCGCRLFPNCRPMMTCMKCQEAICSGCRHVGSHGGVLCHVCRDLLLEARNKEKGAESSTASTETALQVIVYEFGEDKCHQITITKHHALIGQEDWYSNLVSIDHCLFDCSSRAFKRGMSEDPFSNNYAAQSKLRNGCERARKMLWDNTQHTMKLPLRYGASGFWECRSRRPSRCSKQQEKDLGLAIFGRHS
jgi:hypothetical protein